MDNIEVMENIEKNIFENYVDNALPQVFDFAIDVILACVVFFIGTKLVKWVVNIIRKSMERAYFC